MKRITANSLMVKWAGILGLTTLFAGTLSLLPAQADEYGRDNRDRNALHRDIADIRRDQDHLHDLYHRRDFLVSRRDWKAVHRLDDEIARLQWHIDHDRQEIRQDAQRYHRDQDRDYNQDRNRIDRDRYGSNSGYNGGYRSSQADYPIRNNDGRSDYRVH